MGPVCSPPTLSLKKKLGWLPSAPAHLGKVSPAPCWGRAAASREPSDKGTTQKVSIELVCLWDQGSRLHSGFVAEFDIF